MPKEVAETETIPIKPKGNNLREKLSPKGFLSNSEMSKNITE